MTYAGNMGATKQSTLYKSYTLESGSSVNIQVIDVWAFSNYEIIIFNNVHLLTFINTILNTTLILMTGKLSKVLETNWNIVFSLTKSCDLKYKILF